MLDCSQLLSYANLIFEVQTIEYLNAKDAHVEEVVESEEIEENNSTAEIVEEIVEKEILTIEINKKDHDKLLDILDISGVEYKFL